MEPWEIGLFWEHYGSKFVRNLSEFRRIFASCVYSDLYYIAFPNDRRFVKLIVFTQFLLENVQTIMLAQYDTQHFPIPYSNPNEFNDIGTLWITVGLLTGMSMYNLHDLLNFKPPLTKLVDVLEICSCCHNSGILLLSSQRADKIEIRRYSNQLGKINCLK